LQNITVIRTCRQLLYFTTAGHAMYLEIFSGNKKKLDAESSRCDKLDTAKAQNGPAENLSQAKNHSSSKRLL